ncbi:hypothetical protein SISSUDRAFT_978754 [Sistotremastrum suecicum HHB10207 ss-3]|uniref:DUF590-domain-containing protein n=1 Tax=Sistotremastrum suecicum HHB10207 ss-3 TaxID=1314776 RepID=A0A166HYV2_9AGAM|nr:hypothetical protein SISSUDRAFT_978754 [Sistotremastrum suecicum HHB10207 ss-3]
MASNFEASNPPDVDLILVFSANSRTLSKQEAVEEARNAQDEYNRLIQILTKAGLRATGRRGLAHGQILLLVQTPWDKITKLVQRERHSDFLIGLPSASLPSNVRDFTTDPLSPADRIRLVHTYITSSALEGGLGIVPGAQAWPRLESIMALHSHKFNDTWLQSWTRRQIGFGIGFKELEGLRYQFGESVALYFSFLSSYAQSLIFPAALGLLFFWYGAPYSPIYSTIIVLWSITFVEWWRIRERILSVRWGSRGALKVEVRRPQFRGDTTGKTVDTNDAGTFPWWKRELRMVASVPVITFFAAVLAALLTGIFVFEAFVTQIYTGPGRQYISFSPTILFIALVPRLLAVYRSYAIRATNWENHLHQSTFDSSLTIKTFALSAIVAYLGLALSAFVYVPFHETIMCAIHGWLFTGAEFVGEKEEAGGIFEANLLKARQKVNPSRLQDQMFAYTVTNQIINFGLEVVLPFALRGANSVKANGVNGKKKRVVFDDEKTGEKQEREFLEYVRHQVALPQYQLFDDYSEMVTQFGYVTAWSTIWPLAPLMALFNNWFELRGDALKISTHMRRPLPQRSDTIGPWLESMAFITWLAALTNSALVYLFEPGAIGSRAPISTTLDAQVHTTFRETYSNAIVPALLIALSASHGYILARLLIRHIVERFCWKGSREERVLETADREVKAKYLEGLGGDQVNTTTQKDDLPPSHAAFWERDDGMDELARAIKEA